MSRLSPRYLATLFVAVLMTVMNSGVLALASNWDGGTPSPVTTQAVVDLLVVAEVADQLEAVKQDQAHQARHVAPSCNAGSSDCGGPLPTVGAVSGGSADLWSIYAATAHRDYRGEHQLRPPRL